MLLFFLSFKALLEDGWGWWSGNAYFPLLQQLIFRFLFASCLLLAACCFCFCRHTVLVVVLLSQRRPIHFCVYALEYPCFRAMVLRKLAEVPRRWQPQKAYSMAGGTIQVPGEVSCCRSGAPVPCCEIKWDLAPCLTWFWVLQACWCTWTELLEFWQTTSTGRDLHQRR